MFRRLRARLRIDSAEMAAWFSDVALHQRPAALRYLMHGSLHLEVLQRLVQTAMRPSWLNDRHDVRSMVEQLDEDQWRCQALLSALFPEQPQDEPESPHPLPPDADALFERIQEWWNDPNQRRVVIKRYEKKAWPQQLTHDGVASGLRNESPDHWLGLLILGACQGLGLSTDEQHKGFIELAHQEGWWSVFKNPDNSADWMGVLRTWQDRAVNHLTYSKWVRLFCDDLEGWQIAVSEQVCGQTESGAGWR